MNKLARFSQPQAAFVWHVVYSTCALNTNYLFVQSRYVTKNTHCSVI